MDLNNEDKYRAEARRKIAEAEKRRRQEASIQNRPVKQKSDPSPAAVQKSGIESWEGLNTREKQVSQEARARKQNQKAQAQRRSSRDADAKRQGQGQAQARSGQARPNQAQSQDSKQRQSASQRQSGTKRSQTTQAQSANQRRTQQAEQARSERQTRSQRTNAMPETPREKAALNERLRKIHKRKNQQRTIMLSILVVLVLTVTATLIYLVMNQRSTNANLQFIYEGNVTEAYGATALVVRDEITVAANTGGTVVPMVPEGYYARVGEDVAMIIGADMNSTLTELENYRRQISDVQLEMISAGKVDGAAIVYSEADKKLDPLVSELRRTIASKRFGGLSIQMEQLTSVLQERTDNLSDILYDNAILDTLNAEKAILEQQLAVNSERVVTTKAGLVSFASDGLESELDSALMRRITSEEVVKYIEKNDNLSALSREVINGQVIMRQVTGIDQYFSMLVPNLSYSFFTDRKSVDVYIPSEDLRINDIEIVTVEPRVGAVYLVLKTDKAVARLLDQRTIQIDIIANEMHGLRVPMSALRRQEDDLMSQTKLIVVSEGYYREIEVMLRASNGSYAIVESMDEAVTLRQGSLIVLNPDAIRVGSPVND